MSNRRHQVCRVHVRSQGLLTQAERFVQLLPPPLTRCFAFSELIGISTTVATSPLPAAPVAELRNSPAATLPASTGVTSQQQQQPAAVPQAPLPPVLVGSQEQPPTTTDGDPPREPSVLMGSPSGMLVSLFNPCLSANHITQTRVIGSASVSSHALSSRENDIEVQPGSLLRSSPTSPSLTNA